MWSTTPPKMRRKQDFTSSCLPPQKRRPGILNRAPKRPATATLKVQESSVSRQTAATAVSTAVAAAAASSEPPKLVYQLMPQEPVFQAVEAPKVQIQPEGTPVVMVVSAPNADPGDEFREAHKTLVVHVKRVYDESDEGSAQPESLDEVQASASIIDTKESVSESEPKEAEDSNFASNCVYDANGKMWREIPPHKGLKASKVAVARWYADSQTDRYHCLFCNEIIGAMDLRSHQLDQHKYRLPEVGKSAFLKYIRREKIPVGSALSPGAREGTGACPHCSQTFARRLDLLAHLNVDHEKQFVLFDLEFDSMEEFEQWLEIITYKYMTGYTKNRTNVAQSGIKTQMYLCRMEEKPRKSKVFKTDRRAQNRTRAQYCTAHLVVRFLDYGRLHVKGSPTHINHDVSLFSACRSLDDVPMDGLPGYAAVISASSRGMPKTTLDVCQAIFRKADAMKTLMGTCPAPVNKNVVKILHSKLYSMLDPISSYKLKAVVLQDGTQETDFVEK